MPLSFATVWCTRQVLRALQNTQPLGKQHVTRDRRSAPLLASFLGTGDGAADCSNSRAWRTSHQGNLLLPGEPRWTKVLLAADRAVAAVLTEVGHVYISAANLPVEQVRHV